MGLRAPTPGRPNRLRAASAASALLPPYPPLGAGEGRVGVIGARLSRVDSLPPCGGGSGWRVVPWGTGVPTGSTPTPDPSPQGGGEECGAWLCLNLAPMRVGSSLRLALCCPQSRAGGGQQAWLG